MNNTELIEEYKKFIAFEKRLSSSSVKSYLRDINELLKLMGNKKLNSYSIEDIRKNIAILHSKGLSGKSLHSLVDLIKVTAQERQVLCITHQPFLAATGNTHFKVKKNVINGTTFTSISKLITKKERQNELIELIGGGFSEANNYASTLIDRAAA